MYHTSLGHPPPPHTHAHLQLSGLPLHIPQKLYPQGQVSYLQAGRQVGSRSGPLPAGRQAGGVKVRSATCSQAGSRGQGQVSYLQPGRQVGPRSGQLPAARQAGGVKVSSATCSQAGRWGSHLPHTYTPPCAAPIPPPHHSAPQLLLVRAHLPHLHPPMCSTYTPTPPLCTPTASGTRPPTAPAPQAASHPTCFWYTCTS